MNAHTRSMTTTMTTSRAPRAAAALAGAGVLLGICAGLVQLLLGSSIPEWTGNKMDPTGLGLTTIVLSLVAAVALWQLRRPLPTWARAACVLAGVACAAVCFSTVGRLWYVPGPLLLAATVLAAMTAPAATTPPAAMTAPDISDKQAPPDAADAQPEEAPGDARTERTITPAPRALGSWILYGISVVVGLAVALGSLLTVLIGRGPSSVAIAAAVLLVGGLALSAGVAPGLRRRAAALSAAGGGAGLMAGGLLLGSIAIMIAVS
jgi:hypothetical protein